MDGISECAPNKRLSFRDFFLLSVRVAAVSLFGISVFCTAEGIQEYEHDHEYEH